MMELKDLKQTITEWPPVLPTRLRRGEPLPTLDPSPVPTGFIGVMQVDSEDGDICEVAVLLSHGRLNSLDRQAIADDMELESGVRVRRITEYSIHRARKNSRESRR
jgi:hypothetical protein